MNASAGRGGVFSVFYLVAIEIETITLKMKYTQNFTFCYKIKKVFLVCFITFL